jgi:hypothetical protein
MSLESPQPMPDLGFWPHPPGPMFGGEDGGPPHLPAPDGSFPPSAHPRPPEGRTPGGMFIPGPSMPRPMLSFLFMPADKQDTEDYGTND